MRFTCTEAKDSPGLTEDHSHSTIAARCSRRSGGLSTTESLSMAIVATSVSSLATLRTHISTSLRDDFLYDIKG
jgi:hypothetical protein